MAQPYKVIEKKNLSKKEGQPDTKFYAIPKYSGRTDTDSVCKMIGARSTVSSADVKGVIDNLVFVLEMELNAGRIVEIDGLGSFRLSLSSIGVENKKDFKPSMIKGSRLLFTPQTPIRDIVRSTTFVSQNESANQSGDNDRPGEV